MDISISSLILRGAPAITAHHSLGRVTGWKAQRRHSEKYLFQGWRLSRKIYPDIGVEPNPFSGLRPWTWHFLFLLYLMGWAVAFSSATL
jgi:hypothetical protein